MDFGSALALTSVVRADDNTSITVTGFGALGRGAAGTNVYRLFNHNGSFTDNGLTIGLFPTYAIGFIDVSTPGQINLLVIPNLPRSC